MGEIERRWFNAARTIWCIFGIVLVGLMLWRPGRTVMQPYADGSNQFWAHILPPKDFLTGYYYLPASQILYTPIALLGERAGGVLLELMGLAMMTWAAWELVRLLVPERVRFGFSIVLLLIIPGVAGILRTIQLDSLLWPLTALAAAALAQAKYWRAAAMLALAFAIKPTAIVALLLMGATWPAVGLRLVPLVLAVLVAPFLFADRAFVMELYLSLFERINGAVAEPRNWNDLGNLLNHVGMPVPFGIMMMIRAAAALPTLGLAILAKRRLPPPMAAFSAFALAALYLLLFNPRTEGGGYAGLSLVAAPLAARMLLIETRPVPAAMLMAVCVLMGLPGLTPLTMQMFGVWMKPTLGLAVTLLALIPRALDPRAWQPRPAEVSQSPLPALGTQK